MTTKIAYRNRRKSAASAATSSRAWRGAGSTAIFELIQPCRRRGNPSSPHAKHAWSPNCVTLQLDAGAIGSATAAFVER